MADAARSGFMIFSGDLGDDSSLMAVLGDANLSDIGIGSPKIGGAGPVRLEDLALAAVGVTAGRFREDRGTGMFLGVVLGFLLVLGPT